MDSLIIVLLVFATGFVVGRRTFKTKKNHVITTDNRPEKTPPKKYYRPPEPVKIYRDSRWEGKNELFWGMIEEGLHIEGKKYVCSFTENEYLKNLITWFDKNCFINCQVSLGQLMIFPDQPGFSDEERKRFFSIYNSMTMDYVLVSKKTYQIVCVIELDDISHEKEERIERDKKLNELMSVAKIPLLHVPVSEMHVQPDIWGCRKAIKSS